MKVLLLGATGRTGQQLLPILLERGHSVHALVRNREKAYHKHERLLLFESFYGDAGDPQRLGDAMEGCDSILSTLNISRKNDFPWSPLRTPKDFLSQTMQTILYFANEQSVRRIIFTSAWGVGDTRADIPGWFRWFIDHSNIGPAYKDHERQEQLVEVSDLEWTVVRPVGLVNSRKDKPVRVSLSNQPKPRLLISRRLTAQFMVDCLEGNKYVRKKPVIFW